MKKIFFILSLGIFIVSGISGCSKNNNEPNSENANNITGGSTFKNSPPSPSVENAIPVRTGLIKEEKIEETLELQGNISAKEYAVIPSKTEGIIEKLYSNEGSKVVKFKTKLFKIDSEILKNNLTIQKHSLGVAESALEESQANLERIKADNEKVTIDYERAKRLFEKNVITRDMFELQESRCKQSAATLKHSQAAVKLAEESLKQASASFAIAKRKLDDAEVFAPIDGYISKRYREEGEMAKFGDPVFRIDNTSILELSAFLPAEYYSKIIPNKTRVDILINGVELNTQIISYKSPTLEENFRTFEIKSIINNPARLISPGSMANIKVYTAEKKNSLTIPKSAVINKDGKLFIYLIKNNKALLTEIKIEAESNGKAAISGADINKDSKIIIEGQTLVKNGDSVEEL